MPSSAAARPTSLDRFQIQEARYAFPYHYIPHFDAPGRPSVLRTLSWGLEYLCYMHHIKQLVDSLAPASVLEVGCGDGRFIGLLGTVARRVGVDLAPRAIQFARVFNPDVEFFAEDAADLGETFDAVMAIEVLEHVPDEGIGQFLRTLAARTKDGGHVVICVPTTVTPVIPKHYRHYELSLFQQQLESSGAPLNIVQVDYVFRKTPALKLYLRLMHNAWWSFELRGVQHAVWRYIWNRLRVAQEGNGRHLVLVLEKQP